MIPDSSYKALLHPGDSSDFFEFEKPPVFTATSAYTIDNALICSELARAVYVEHEARLVEYLGRIGLTLIARFDRGGTQAMLCWSQEWDVAFLVFRGSTEFQDWKDNLTAYTVSWRQGGSVHAGFARALDRVWPAVKAEIDKLQCPVFYGGHSLGNALALLAASLRAPMAVYGYGGPAVGDLAFISSLSKIPIFRHTHGADVVPNLLPTLKHVGLWKPLPEINLGWRWSWFKEPPRHLRCHIMNLYSCALEGLQR